MRVRDSGVSRWKRRGGDDHATTSTFRGKDGASSLPAVGNVMLEKFQVIGLSDGLNLKDSSKMDNTTSVKVFRSILYIRSGVLTHLQLREFESAESKPVRSSLHTSHSLSEWSLHACTAATYEGHATEFRPCLVSSRTWEIPVVLTGWNKCLES